jgi:PAS domain S-box-containing protein
MCSGAIGWRREDRLRTGGKPSFPSTPSRRPHLRSSGPRVPDGSVDFLSHQLYDYSGVPQGEGLDWGWKQALHPDDLGACMERWEHSIRTGDAYEMEYRIRGSDGLYRWFIVRANALRNDQRKIIKWIGTCTDIEDQKHHQQLFEQQIKERTEELAEVNLCLQEEMAERDYARQELDQQNEKSCASNSTIAAGDPAGQDGRASSELHQQRRSIRRRPGLCSEDFAHQSRRGRAAQRRMRPGRGRRPVARVPNAGDYV